jgi:hypothetical protein
MWTVWGLRDRLIRDPDIWACYYCGECSEKCPRGADPGELMMALRRYAISRYDWTGISRLLYTSRFWSVALIGLLSMVVVGLFALSGAFASERMVTSHVAVNTFIPVEWVHRADWVMAGILTFFLVTNAFRMVRLVLDGRRVPLSALVTQIPTLLIHAATQKRWRDCERKSNRWLKHFVLVTGYTTMFVLVMFFLPALQVDGSQFTWASIPGYYATIAILYFTVDALLSRMRKREFSHRFSHESDWMFLILLFLTGLTGILMHAFRLMGLPLPTYYIYVIHLAVVVPMLIIEVPFGKWAHLVYRPLALYLKVVLDKVGELENTH